MSAGSTKLSSRSSLTSTYPAATAQGACEAVGQIYALHWVICSSFTAHRFDEYMDHVRGLAPGTRSMAT